MSSTHYHYGHNTAGYLPESDIGTASTFDEAKRGLIDEMLYVADHYGMMLDEDQGESTAENLTNAAEVVNLASGPELVEYVDEGRSIDTAYWVSVCTEDECAEELAESLAAEEEGRATAETYSAAAQRLPVLGIEES